MPNSSQASAAAFITGQSESLPMIMPTIGLREVLMALTMQFHSKILNYEMAHAGRLSGA